MRYGNVSRDFRVTMAVLILAISTSCTAQSFEGSSDCSSAKPHPKLSKSAIAAWQLHYPLVAAEENVALLCMEAMESYQNPFRSFALVDVQFAPRAINSESTEFRALRRQHDFARLLHGELPISGAEPLDAELQTWLREFIRLNEETLHRFDRIAFNEGFRFPIDYHSMDEPTPCRLADLEDLVELLCGDALNAALNGNTSRSVGRLEDASRLVGALAAIPGVYTQFRRWRQVTTILHVLQQVASQVPSDPTQWQRLSQTVNHLDEDAAMRSLMEGFRWRLERPLTAFDMEMPAIAIGRVVVDGRTEQQIQKHAARLVAEREEVLADIEIYVALLNVSATSLAAKATSRMESTAVESRGVAVSVLHGMKCLALIRVTLVGLAAMEYKAQHNMFPDKLEMLAPQFLSADLLVDPLSGNRLGWQVTESGAVVYSVGETKDNEYAKLEKPHAISSIMFHIPR